MGADQKNRRLEGSIEPRAPQYIEMRYLERDISYRRLVLWRGAQISPF